MSAISQTKFLNHFYWSVFLRPAGLFNESDGEEDSLPEEDEKKDDDDLHNSQDNH